MNTKPLYVPYIDGLRAIAVLSVIVYHLNAAWLPGGFAGVDVFFVISGFVVSSSVSTLGRMGLPSFMLHFYARRLVRITPALVVCLLATSAASALFIPHAWLSRANQDTGLFAFIGLSNFVLANNVGNYFSPSAESNPFTHTWSLAVEEQFYLVFPLLFVAWLATKRTLSTTLFALCFAASFVCAIWLARVDEARAFYMIWSRFWELGAGVLLFQLMVSRGHSFTEPTPSRRFAMIGALLSAVVLAIGLVVARPENAPFPACMLPVLGTVGLLGFLHGRSSGIVSRLLNLPVLRFIGKISYSLYLWHWPVFVLFRWTAGLESPLCRLSALSITAVLSVASYYLVETPPRRAAKHMRRIVLVASGLAIVAFGYAASSAIASNQSAISLSTVMRNADQWYPDTVGQSAAHPTCRVATQAKNAGGGALSIYERTGCTDPVTFAHRVFVIGDSHAMAYLPMLGQFVLNTGATVYAYNNGGCSFIDLMQHAPGGPDQCDRYGEAAVADILPQIQPGDVVFLPSLRLPRIANQFAIGDEASARAEMFSPAERAARSDGTARAIPVLRQMADRGARIVFEGPTPVLEISPFRCADWFNRGNPVCKKGNSSVSRAFLEELRAPVLHAYADMAKTVPAISVWDPFPTLCPGEFCASSVNGSPLYFDGDHLSGYANRYLLPSFSSFIQGGAS